MNKASAREKNNWKKFGEIWGEKKMENITIRQETERDYEAVEKLTREAFWNVYEPGCTEHYMVHVIRSHQDYIPELDLIAEINGEIVGHIIYTKSKLVDENGVEKDILSFGPLSVSPTHQRKGIGKKIQAASFEKAVEMGYGSVVIFGNPGNYVTSGFKSCKKYNVCMKNDIYPTPLLVKELMSGAFDGRKCYFLESEAGNFDPKEAEVFDVSLNQRKRNGCQARKSFTSIRILH